MKRLKWYWILWTAYLVSWVGTKIGKPSLAGNGRHTDLWPYCCEECGHVMRVKDAVHIYCACGEDDMESVDECPKCGSENLNLAGPNVIFLS